MVGSSNVFLYAIKYVQTFMFGHIFLFGGFMLLTKKQFDVLSTIATTKEKLSQRQLSENTGLSVGTVNKIIKELSDLGYISDV